MATGRQPSLELDTTSRGLESAALLQSYSGSNYIEVISPWMFLENATKSRFGRRIRVLQTSQTMNALDKFFEDFQFSVLYHDPEPTETRHTVIDIHNKEYFNRSDQERDETVVHITKPSALTHGNRYHFTPTSGILFNFDKDIGAKIVGLAAAGGSVGVREGDSATGQHHNISGNFNFEYKQEEKVPVPPKTKVKAKITTSTIKYEMRYTLEVKIPSSRFISVAYQNMCQTLLCGICRSTGIVYAADMLHNLPNFKEENGWCIFNQVGLLSWVGENCTVEKTEVQL